MTRKDFVLIARELAQALEDAKGDRRAEAVVLNTIGRFVFALAETNPRFNAATFRKACGVADLGKVGE